MSPDDPIVPADQNSTPFGEKVNVLEIDNFRVKFGRPKRKHSDCSHNSLIYNTADRRIWCEDCETTIDNFSAFMRIRDIWASADDEIRRREQAVQEAEKHAILSRAAKAVDKAFRQRGHVPVCPHCSHALLPEDVLRLDRGQMVSKEIEIARRKRAALDKEPDRS